MEWKRRTVGKGLCIPYISCILQYWRGSNGSGNHRLNLDFGFSGHRKKYTPERTRTQLNFFTKNSRRPEGKLRFKQKILTINIFFPVWFICHTSIKITVFIRTVLYQTLLKGIRVSPDTLVVYLFSINKNRNVSKFRWP